MSGVELGGTNRGTSAVEPCGKPRLMLTCYWEGLGVTCGRENGASWAGLSGGAPVKFVISVGLWVASRGCGGRIRLSGC